MCGRFMQDVLEEDLRDYFDAKKTHHATEQVRAPRYNIGPGQDIWVVRLDKEHERSLDALHWGLIPHFAKDRKIAYRTINARGETVDTTPVYRQAFEKRRCLVVAHAFYEWRKEGKRKQPFAIAKSNRELMGLAGVWENWHDPNTGEWVRSVSIVTTAASKLLRDVHERMPVIVAREDFPLWLGEAPASREQLKALLVPTEQGLRVWPIDARMNKVEVDDAEILTPVQLGEEAGK